MTQTLPVPPAHPVAAVLASSRPISWINTAYPFAAAYLMSGGQVGATFIVLTVFFLVPYNLLMYGINDVFDYESDLRNPRKGGVEGVVLDRGLHRLTLWSAVLAALPFLVFAVVVALTSVDVNPLACLASLAVSVAAVIAYSAPGLRFKERPVLDSLTSSTHFVSPAVVGLAYAGASPSAAVWVTLAAFFLWGVASQAFGAVQDIVADRSGGIASIATAFGAARTVRFAIACYLASALLMLGAGWPGALAAVIPLVYLVNIAGYRSLVDADCERSNAGWRRFLWLNIVSGFLITQLLIWIALR
ncbi:4-hydroxybenzoate polyprenyltransferase [Sanguibacter gelidistatuariae]|uniref:4-hydroxybenzoate polyprenyltransferase n=1 Tax=Sanguibacter gelidistatuariae TaxID=1814289 RepID=A0A1G6RUA3_9MICO|nr:prenyltransferase [Sanguibacter gelidistatuariae]SDD08138.1 4-hydroxybenzoate polyprenyltransferase [Sanguibacter gelidistatuariae]